MSNIEHRMSNVEIERKKNSGPETNVELSAAKPEAFAEQTGVFVHKKNSGNQPESQSSIKKRTVNQTAHQLYAQKVYRLDMLGVIINPNMFLKSYF